MVSYEKFASEIKELILHYLPEEYTKAELHTTIKNNDTKLIGISVKNANSDITPIIYLDNAYDAYRNHGEDLIYICQDLASEILERNRVKYDISKLTEAFKNFDKIKGNVTCKLVNIESNKDYLSDKPYREVEDLAVVYMANVNDYVDIGSEGNVVVTNQIMKQWGVSIDELDEIARENLEKSPVEFCNLSEVLEKTLRESGAPEEMIEQIREESAGLPLYILSNESRLNGAVEILNEKAMEKVREELGEDIIIIPSSIHELLILRDDDVASYDSLRELVGSVNTSNVPVNEILSDGIYSYDFNEKSLYRIDEDREKNFEQDERDDI